MWRDRFLFRGKVYGKFDLGEAGSFKVASDNFFPPQTNDVDFHVGRRLRLVRELNSLSLGDFARRLRLRTDQLLQYENGEARIPAVKLFEAASILGIPGGWFFEDLASASIDKKNNHVENDVQVIELRGLIRRMSQNSNSSELVENAQNRLHEIRNIGTK